MSKFLNILCLLLIIALLLLPNFVQATNVDMNLTNNPTSNTTNTGLDNTNTDSLTTMPQTYDSPNIDSLNSLPEANLGLSNILSIILIVIGVLLILLAIAIIIRLKH